MTELDTSSLFFSMLGLVALAGSVVAYPVLISGRLSERAASARDLLVDAVGPVAIPLALTVAVVAVFGSLWFSEVVGLIPCRFCWYQRYLIYPQVLILIAALATRSPWARRVSLVFAVLAISVSTYHYTIEWFPSLDKGSCSVDTPCTFVWFRRFGFLTIPGLAWLTSASIIWLVTVGGTWNRREHAMIESEDPDGGEQ